MQMLFERFLKNLSSWALTTKVYVIFHRCLQDQALATPMATELKSKEHLLHPFQKKASDTSYETKMYAELSVLYSNYIKFLLNYKVQSKLLSMRMSDVSPSVKKLSISDLLMNYEHFDGLVTQIFNLFEHQNFCKKTRLYSNVIFLLVQDLIQIYKVFYVIVTEVLERFPQLNVDQAKKIFIVYQNFVDLTKTMKSKVDYIMMEFNFNLQLPQYYTPDQSLVSSLKYCIDNMKSGGNLQQIST